MIFGNIPSSVSEALCDRAFLEYYCCVMDCERFRNFRRFDFSQRLTFWDLFFAIFRNFCNFRFSQFSLLWLFAMSHFFETFCARLVYAMSQLFETFCARVVYAMSQLFWDFFVQGWFTRKKYETALFPSSSTTGHCLNFLDHLLIFALRWCIFEIFA